MLGISSAIFLSVRQMQENTSHELCELSQVVRRISQVSARCSLKEGGASHHHGRPEQEAEWGDRAKGRVISVPQAGVEGMQRAPGDAHTHYWYCPQEEVACQRLEVSAAGTWLPAVVQKEIQSLGERTRIRGDVFKEEGMHFFPFLFHLKSTNWLSACVATVISDAVRPQGL